MLWKHAVVISKMKYKYFLDNNMMKDNHSAFLGDFPDYS